VRLHNPLCTFLDKSFNSACIKQQLLQKTHTDCALSTTSSVFLLSKRRVDLPLQISVKASLSLFYGHLHFYSPGRVSVARLVLKGDMFEEDKGLEFKTSDAAHCPTGSVLQGYWFTFRR